MKRELGSRIGAIQSADQSEVLMFGYGTYQGDHVPPDDVMGPFATRIGLFAHKNPKLVMDDGTVVWGCECWWGPEDQIAEAIAGRTVVIVQPKRTPCTDAEREEAASIMAEAKKAVEGLVLGDVKDVVFQNGE